MQFFILDIDAHQCTKTFAQKRWDHNGKASWDIQGFANGEGKFQIVERHGILTSNNFLIPVSTSAIASVRSLLAMGRSLYTLSDGVFDAAAKRMKFKKWPDPLKEYWNFYDERAADAVHYSRVPYYWDDTMQVNGDWERPGRNPVEMDGSLVKKTYKRRKYSGYEHWKRVVDDDKNFSNFELEGILDRLDADPLTHPFTRLSCWTGAVLMMRVAGFKKNDIDPRIFNAKRLQRGLEIFRSLKVKNSFNPRLIKLEKKDGDSFLRVLTMPNGMPIFAREKGESLLFEELGYLSWKDAKTGEYVPSPFGMVELAGAENLFGHSDRGKVFMPPASEPMP